VWTYFNQKFGWDDIGYLVIKLDWFNPSKAIIEIYIKNLIYGRGKDFIYECLAKI
jgi:hypothetical protein